MANEWISKSECKYCKYAESRTLLSPHDVSLHDSSFPSLWLLAAPTSVNMYLLELAFVWYGAYAGVLLRFFTRWLFELLYGLGSSPHFSPGVVTSIPGPLFRDMFSNMGGSFALGLLVATKEHNFFQRCKLLLMLP
jgi:hypothetical protein